MVRGSRAVENALAVRQAETWRAKGRPSARLARRATEHLPMDVRRTGIPAVGSVPWGTHICQVYETPADLLEVLVP